jgi:hypothetical protein
MGVRHLAMEALQPGDAETANTTRRPPDAAGGYLAQPDMAELIQARGVSELILSRHPVVLVDQSTQDVATTQLRKGRRTRWVTTHRRYGRA